MGFRSRRFTRVRRGLGCRAPLAPVLQFGEVVTRPLLAETELHRARREAWAEWRAWYAWQERVEFVYMNNERKKDVVLRVELRQHAIGLLIAAKGA